MSRPEIEILYPAPATGAGKSREIVPSGGRAGVFRDALFVDMATGIAAAGGSTAFVAQHLDQEWTHRRPYADPRPGLAAYDRARRPKRIRSDLIPPI